MIGVWNNCPICSEELKENFPYIKCKSDHYTIYISKSRIDYVKLKIGKFIIFVDDRGNHIFDGLRKVLVLEHYVSFSSINSEEKIMKLMMLS